MIRWRYERVDDKYVLTEIGDLLGEEYEHKIYEGEEVGISYMRGNNGSPSSILYHGNPETVTKAADQIRFVFMQEGKKDQAVRVGVVTGRMEVEDLNRAVNETGYIDELVRKISSPPAIEEGGK